MGTLFGPERIQARAIDWDQSDRGIHQGAQQSCNPDAVYMAATDQTQKSIDQHLPSGHHPYTVRATMTTRVKIRDKDSRIVKNKAVYLALGVTGDGSARS